MWSGWVVVVCVGVWVVVREASGASGDTGGVSRRYFTGEWRVEGRGRRGVWWHGLVGVV